MGQTSDIGRCDLLSGVWPTGVLFYLLTRRNSKSKSNKTQLYQFEIEMLGGEKYNETRQREGNLIQQIQLKFFHSAFYSLGWLETGWLDYGEIKK